eukprot:scaffold3644_cov365-Prasinococcus_capsulatus_cf.AAC.1
MAISELPDACQQGREMRLEAAACGAEVAWVRDHRVQAQTLYPEACFTEVAAGATATSSGWQQGCALQAVAIPTPLVLA